MATNNWKQWAPILTGASAVFGICCTLMLGRPCFAGGEKSAREQSSADWLQRLERLHRTIKPAKDEWRFASLPWVSTVAEARQQAAAEGKPMFIWYMVGEPLGQC